MKNWLSGLSLFLFGMLLAAILFLVTSPPRGHGVELLPAPTLSPIIVQVDGAVAHPGVYQLPRESRVGDAINVAGGLSTTADQYTINLAGRIKDGEKITVPVVGTGPTVEPDSLSSVSISSTSTVNINEASKEDLESLPGIGSTRAQQIIAYREAHDGFKSIDELLQIKGIGPAIFEQLKDFVTVD